MKLITIKTSLFTEHISITTHEQYVFSSIFYLTKQTYFTIVCALQLLEKTEKYKLQTSID